jgi:flagellar basal-body rod protein FlgC
MDLFQSMEISASGLNAQRGVLNAISMNLANANSTRTEEGGPYIRRRAVLSPVALPTRFPQILTGKMDRESPGVSVEIEVDETRDHEMIYDPGHPDAGEDGYVILPNVNIIEEMVNLMAAVRCYEANVTAFNAAKGMVLKSLEIGK